jgi:pimeloyl-ACP methyl ester carboxylesterase
MSVHHFRQRTDLLPGSQIEVEGLRIAYRWSGEGLPLLLLHGFVGDSREWRRQIEDLSNEFTVVAWDAPGSGGSSDPPEAFRLADYADCLAEFIDTLGLGRPHVAGISFGGALALELYRRHPAQPLSLVLASAYAGWTGSLPAEIVEQRLQQTLQAAHLPPDQFVRSMIPTMFSDSPPPEPLEEFRQIMLEMHPGGFRTMARSLAEADLRDVLAHITVPTLLLYGDKDVRAPMTVAQDLLTRIPTSRLTVLPGIGHMSSVEAADDFNAEVRSFLRSVPA